MGRFLGPLMKVGLSLMKNILTTFAKIVLILLALTAAVSAGDTGTHQKILGSGTSRNFVLRRTTLIMSN